MTTRGQREFDIALVGCTGFVGRLVAEHLAAAAPVGARIVLAGRNAERVGKVAADVGRPEWATLTVDVTDRAQAEALADRADVVITTVGPYRTYGEHLVAACAAAGTDYVDLTGETLFVAESVERNHATAQRTGGRIVHSCGFDSVPSDLGMELVRGEAVTRGEPVPGLARMYVKDTRGGVSGGTVASITTQLAETRGDTTARRLVADPLALAPGGGRPPRVPERLVARDPATGGAWIAPFLMAVYNTRVVQRSRYLHGDGPLSYQEYVETGRGVKGFLKAAVVAGATVGGAALLTYGGPLVNRFLPQAGDGPSQHVRDAGHYAVQTIGLGERHRYVAEFADDRDPGYGSTAVMLGESALALAFDGLPARGGVLTPAVALGEALVNRLREQGFRISVRTV